MQLNDLEQEDEDFRNFLKEVDNLIFCFLYKIYYFFQVALPKKADENKQKVNTDERIGIKPEPGLIKIKIQ